MITSAANKETRENDPVSDTPSLGTDRVLVWVCVFVIATSLVGLVTTLLGVFHAPQVALIGALLTLLYGFKTYSSSAALPGLASRWMHVVVLVLVALIFRVPAYHYVLGGQDEGVYVNVGHFIERTGGVAVHDRVKQELQGTPFLEPYLRENTIGGNSYLAGVYARDYKNGKLEFQFYHVFPIWIALFDGIFGKTAGVLALTALSILSIILFYRLALLLSHSYRVALIASVLLTVNPLHAFFSKFPVTEVPTLCFALAGFLFITAQWSDPLGTSRKYWIPLSVLAFLCVFTTRISGFMYVPFFIGLAWAELIFDSDRVRCRAVQCWAISVIFAYLASVVYGLIWSHAYSHDIYSLSFMPLLGEHWKVVLLVIGVLIPAVWALLVWVGGELPAGAKLVRWLKHIVEWGPSVVVWVALCLGLFKIYRLGWTDHYLTDPWLGTMWNLAAQRWTSASASSLWALVVFMGPLLPLAFLGLTVVRRRNAPIIFLFWFVSGFFAYIAVLQWILPYLPYYSRYLASELVPYSILLIACMWGTVPIGFWRALLTGAIAISGLYAVRLSAAQIGKNENDGAYTALARVMMPVGPSDLVLLRVRPGDGFDQSQLKTPLLYTFNREVVTVDGSDLSDAAYLSKLDSLYNNVYLLQAEGAPPPGFELLASTKFTVMKYRWTHSFPRKLQSGPNVVLDLFQMEGLRLPVNAAATFSSAGIGARWLGTGWGSPEKWGTWSNGIHAVLRVDPRDLPDVEGALTLQIHANVFVTPSHPTQRIVVAVDGAQVGEYTVTYPQAQLIMTVPFGHVDVLSSRRIVIGFDLPDAVSPLALGVSRDGRDLALGLISARVQSSPNAQTTGHKKVPAQLVNH
jgi:hypothetical protein